MITEFGVNFLCFLFFAAELKICLNLTSASDLYAFWKYRISVKDNTMSFDAFKMTEYKYCFKYIKYALMQGGIIFISVLFLWICYDNPKLGVTGASSLILGATPILGYCTSKLDDATRLYFNKFEGTEIYAKFGRKVFNT